MNSINILIITQLITLIVLINQIHSESIASVSLNELTFDKLINKFPVSLVKFDVAFPYGEKYDIFKNLARDLVGSSDLLLAEIGVKDYGDKENEVLADRYKVDKASFPVLKLFIRGKTQPIDFPDSKDFTGDNIKQFIRQNAPKLYMGLPGCLEMFDKIAQVYVSKSHDERLELLKEAELYLDDLIGEEDKRRGKIYIRTMEKINEKGDRFPEKEKLRVENILRSTKSLTTDKRREMEERLNIIQSFIDVVESPDSDRVGFTPEVKGEL